MLCHKCKVNQPFEDDSWCLSCSAWESIGSDLVSRWDIPGLRELACEAVVSTARHLKGLRRLSSGLAAAGPAGGGREKAKRGAAEALAKSEPKEEIDRREPLPRSRSRAEPVAPVAAKDEDASSEYEDIEDEGEESEDFPGTKRLAYAPSSASKRERPPEPAGPPPAGSKTSESGRGEHRHRDREERSKGENSDKRRRKRKHRAGRKHKNLSRLVDNPRARVHRSLDGSYWSRPSRNQEGFGHHT